MQISIDFGHILFLFSFFLLAFGGGFIIIIGPILTVLTPRKLLKTYFKKPHFSELELDFMSGFPGAYFRMVVFAWTVLRPTKSHVKRNMADCHKVMPRWYLYSLKAFIIIGLTPCVISFGIMAVLYINASIYNLS